MAEDEYKISLAGNQHKTPLKMNSAEEDTFCLSSYDCIGFDMDLTVVQYHIAELFKLLYKSFASYLIEKKGYDKHLLEEDFLKYEDYSLRGLTFEVQRGNFVKLDDKGYILRACHGMTPMSDEEIENTYGKERIWKLFPQLKEKVHHGATYKCFENFFDMPMGVLCARIVDIIDETQGRQSSYKFWPDVIESIESSFSPMCFSEHRGYFFTTIKNNADKYIKKCPKEVVNWLKSLRKAGKLTFLLTQSYFPYTEFLMEYAVGEDWRSIFDFIITDGKKPGFFSAKPEDRPFISPDDKKPVVTLERHTLYAQGNATLLEDIAKRLLKKDSVKVVYFGDSPKSDIFPAHKYMNWDTVAILEEMEAEEVHFRKHSDCYNSDVPGKKPRMVNHLLKEEKIIVASKQWGSFFRHDKQQEENKNCHEEKVNTFWGSVIRENSKIAIPLLDYLTDLPLDYKFQSFSKTKLGFYPGPPSTVVHEH